ncbi:MAG: gamma-glutamylcyclotransferase [Ectothiorhodospiraceae bacterium]|nr:gamma-glutamylcyclotransferase [Ectothiorhodospiraceae bacterium]
MLCFAYGSNMSTARLRARTPSARVVSVAVLTEYRLAFHKRSRVDGSAKCDAAYTGWYEDQVIGVVFEIRDSEKPLLDAVEGLGAGYEQRQVHVTAADGREHHVQMYYATDIDDSLKPYDWYREHVLIGARQHGLPAVYVAGIEAVEPVPDPDRERWRRELAVHRSRDGSYARSGV